MTIKYTQSEQRAIRIAENIKKGGTITAEIDKDCQAEHKYLKGEKMKTAKQGGAFAVRLRETLIGLDYSGQHLNNIMGAVKRAVDTGNAFSMNAYRKPAAKGTKSRDTQPKMVSTKSDDKKPEVVIAKRDGLTSEELSKEFRKVFEKMREGHADLVSFLIDALDEFDGK